MSKFIEELSALYKHNASPEYAVAMAKYMKGHFLFFGIKTDLRRPLHKHTLENNKAEIKADFRTIALELYRKPEREFHYSSIEILIKELKKKFTLEDIKIIEYLLVTHSWWDSVDTISKYLLGEYLSQYPEEIPATIARFSGSDNMWLNRAAILFQLGYKKDTNKTLLFSECVKHRNSKEFFIQKAIGWALREYGKTDPDAIRTFVPVAGLKPLSIREALKKL